jgi:formylglycine-generating enzyme
MTVIGPLTLDHPLADGVPPNWASAWGDDEFGPWIEIRVGQAKQRLRWIPPGTFLMGAQSSEGVARENERPQHPVTMTKGFWLFDTPCTQALWEAVTGENPSRFKGADRPVEQVSWIDCQQFIESIGSIVPELQLILPTEAEWEYCCRAGSSESTHSQVLAVNDPETAPWLDDIAWYSKNSGEETHNVAEKEPNEWGLYDMLGNVWEWCRDDYLRTYTSSAAADPLHDESSALRVIRGGSWGSPARLVRAAYRGGILPGLRDDDLGFRCSSSGR